MRPNEKLCLALQPVLDSVKQEQSHSDTSL